MIVGIYVRVPPAEIEGFQRDPSGLVALCQGDRALDLGRRWQELGCLLEGGIAPPRTGPTVGDLALLPGEDTSDSPTGEERAVWSYVLPDRVREIAAELSEMNLTKFMELYMVDEFETADEPPSERTERILAPSAHLWRRFEQLRAHYKRAAAQGEAMLVRIGERL